MKKCTYVHLSISLALIFATTAIAQKSSAINHVEVFGGFSYNHVISPYATEDLQDVDSSVGGTNLNTNLGKAYRMKGGEVAITGNFSKYVGATFDFSTHNNNRSFTAGTSNIQQKYRLSNFLFGIQIKNNKKDGPRVKPFARILAGLARQNVNLTGLSGSLANFFEANQISEKQTNLALAFGGGLDVKVHRHIDIRVFQIEYNPTYVKETDDFSTQYQGNVRFSFGIVIH